MKKLENIRDALIYAKTMCREISDKPIDKALAELDKLMETHVVISKEDYERLNICKDLY